MVKVKDIENLSIFKGLTDDELKAIAEIITPDIFPAGKQIFEEGEVTCPCVYIIQKGKVDVQKRSKEGDLLTLSVQREGSFFGELSFIDNKPHSATMTTASEESVVMRIDRSDFDKLVQRYPAAGYKVLMNITLDIAKIARRMNTQFMDMSDYVYGRTKR
ncbi:MAG: cyclic nucleotide-binding domain-containing protein [Nitrospirota bacterium]|nr:cyclic nucleotide-binding domain-containing protein [Nitrospirota bacterium]